MLTKRTYKMSQDTVFTIIMHGLVLLTAFPIHECSHALVAHWLGDDTAKNQGRITLNPLKHLDVFGTILMLFAGFGWAKAVPINPNNFKNRKVGMALSSLAGPASNLILAYVSIILAKVFLYSGISEELYQIFLMSTLLNVGLAVFNLIPIPPLDGSRIITLIFPEKTYFNIMKYEQFIFIALFIIIRLGVLDKPIYYLQEATFNVMNALTGWVDIIMTMIMR